MPPLNLLIKPASSNCNLRCRYCFYHSLSNDRSVKSFGMMSMDTLEQLVKKSLEYAEGCCVFAFQGGEPTLIGIDFYKQLIYLQKKYNRRNLKISNTLQTNGIAIDEEWASFLAENKFLVGLSLDGLKDINDLGRIGIHGEGSFNRIMNAVKLFNKYQVEYNILCVVTSYLARHTGKVYSFFKKNGFRYLQFIPCLDPLGEGSGGHDYSLIPEKYGHFLKTLFDLWYHDYIKNDGIDIRYFSNLVQMAAGYPPESCGMSGQCVCYYVIEADGGVYPCDFYVFDEWYLGNVNSEGFEDLNSSPEADRFVEVSKYLDVKCQACKWFSLCRGGCRRNREPLINDKLPLNYYCFAFEEFFRHAGERIINLAHTTKFRNYD